MDADVDANVGAGVDAGVDVDACGGLVWMLDDDVAFHQLVRLY